jgi:hypothetical protein
VLYYFNGDNWTNPAVTKSAFEAGVRFPTIPMCHTTMRAADWRRAWDLHRLDYRTAILRTFAERGVNDVSRVPPGETQAGWTWWVNSDQRVLTYHLCRQPWFPENAWLIPRAGGPPRDRLDRAHVNAWSAPFVPGRYTDAHIHKQPDKPEHWVTLLPIVDALLPQHAQWARQFYRDYRGSAAAGERP